MIEENISFKMVKTLCFYHNSKRNYNLRNALYSGVANMRKMGLKIALFIIQMLIYIKLTYSQLQNLCMTHLKPKNLSNYQLNIGNNMISMLFLHKTLF